MMSLLHAILKALARLGWHGMAWHVGVPPKLQDNSYRDIKLQIKFVSKSEVPFTFIQFHHYTYYDIEYKSLDNAKSEQKQVCIKSTLLFERKLKTISHYIIWDISKGIVFVFVFFYKMSPHIIILTLTYITFMSHELEHTVFSIITVMRLE